ncbi:hypothetical protein PVAND_004701 [Polypedilum vanderplanki]|uniref:Transmembrane protein n=1 Tax=Polypedilum vanderplanki TaxID=319348 RepID=A0A9J6BY04_POLVA|nr:hypothetical protein PVAND_004701 [Polypedilum vanderplanki]
MMDKSKKRSIEGIVSLFENFRNQKSRQAESLRNALYNVGVLILLGALALVILILLPFIRPLGFGVLFGAVLFPAKKKLANSINSWIEKLEKDETPVVVGIVKLPFSALERLGEMIIYFILTHIKIILFGSGFLIFLRVMLYFLPKHFLSYVFGIIQWQHSLFEKIIGSFNSTLVTAIIIAYIIAVYFLWNNSNAYLFMIACQLVWIFIFAYVSSFFGPFQIPVFIITLLYGLLGLIYHDSSSNPYFLKIKGYFKKEEKKIEDIKEEKENEPAGKDILNKTKTHLSEIKSKMQLNVSQEENKSTSNKPDELESDWYFKILFYALALTVLWKQLWILTFCFVPVVFYSIIAIFKSLGLDSYIENQLRNPIQKAKEWFNVRRDALLPIFLPGVTELNQKVHVIFCNKMKSYVDDISSLVMILFLILFVIFISVFSIVQIYSETITVIQLTGNLVNRTLTMRPDLVEMLPFNMQSMNDIIENGYQHSRSTIEEYLDMFLNNTEQQQAEKFKAQVLTVWDRLIQSYIDQYNHHDTVGPRVSSDSIFNSIDEIVTSSGLTFTSAFTYAKNNLSLMREIGESVWIVLRTNIQLLFSLLTTCFGVLIGSGHFMLSFLFNAVIFFTTLYYLLQSSHDRYIPIAVNTNSAMQIRVVDALESSVSSVLIATVKLSIFHGLFTFVTHTIFGAHVVFLPTFLAAILAAAPFLETYWCCIPAFLDLWLSQNHFYLGLLLMAIHFFIPPSFNVIIHSEIKGSGHPYLTALSIAGGIYLLGLEGAIVGPILLCLLIVLFDVTINSLSTQTTPNTFSSSIVNEEIQSPM